MQYVFVYLRKPSTLFNSQYGCAHIPGEKKEMEENLNYWLNEKIGRKKFAKLVPLYMEPSAYQKLIGDSTFCTPTKVLQFLLKNASEANKQEAEFLINDYIKALNLSNSWADQINLSSSLSV